jgi:CheY-like chemotaxis protein
MKPGRGDPLRRDVVAEIRARLGVYRPLRMAVNETVGPVLGWASHTTSTAKLVVFRFDRTRMGFHGFPTSRQVPSFRASMSTASRRILLIDDDDAVRDALAELLVAEGHRVVTAANGREGLDRAAEEPPALVLLDLCMPVMDGWAFRAAQLADPRLAAVPVIVMSASLGAERAGLTVLRPAAFLAKPVDLERLMALVRRYVGAPRTRSMVALALSAAR